MRPRGSAGKHEVDILDLIRRQAVRKNNDLRRIRFDERLDLRIRDRLQKLRLWRREQIWFQGSHFVRKPFEVKVCLFVSVRPLSLDSCPADKSPPQNAVGSVNDGALGG